MEEDLREIVLKVNQIDLQIEVLKALQEKRMSSSELQIFVEGLGGDWVLILPVLKQTNLLKIQKIESSRQYWYWIPNNNGHKEEKPLKVVLPNDKSVQVDRKEIKRTRNKTTDTRI